MVDWQRESKGPEIRGARKHLHSGTSQVKPGTDKPWPAPAGAVLNTPHQTWHLQAASCASNATPESWLDQSPLLQRASRLP